MKIGFDHKNNDFYYMCIWSVCAMIALIDIMERNSWSRLGLPYHYAVSL